MMEAVCDVFWRQSVCGALALQIVGQLPAKNGADFAIYSSGLYSPSYNGQSSLI